MAGRSSPSNRSKDVLEALSSTERSGVLRVLLARHPELESDGPLGWAPDFPTEHAHHVVAELISACPRDERAAVRDRLLDRLDGLVPDWIDLVRAAADRACKGK